MWDDPGATRQYPTENNRSNEMITALTTLLILTASTLESTITEEQIPEIYGATVDDIGTVFNWEAAYDDDVEMYTKEQFQPHIEEMLKDGGAAYFGFVQDIKKDPLMGASLQFVLIGGPTGFYSLMAMMQSRGVLDKKLVKETAGIRTTTASKIKPYFKLIFEDAAEVAWKAMGEHFLANREEYIKRFPEIDNEDITSFLDVIEASNRTTLNTKVATIVVSQTGVATPLALGFRIDAHSAKRNGGWDPKSGAFTKDHDPEKTVARKAKIAAGLAAEEEEEETDDDNSES